MKQFCLTFVLLLASLVTFGKDVTIHVTDQRGAVVSGMAVQIDYEYLYTDSNGDFEMRGLGNAGTYSFNCETSTGWETIRFSWDGTSSVVNISLEGYYVTLRLVGLSEEELSGNWSVWVSDRFYSQIVYVDDDGTASFWWEYDPSISWTFNTDLFGDCSGEVNLEEEKGAISIFPKDGKYKVSLGALKGHGGAALTDVRVDGKAAADFTPIYRSPGTYYMNVVAPGYFPYTLSYQVTSADVAVDVDLSQSYVVKFKFTDRDGTAMENVSVRLGFNYDAPVLVTDASGECEAYAMPGTYSYLPSYEHPLYPSNTVNITVSSQDVTETVDWTGATLLEVRLKNAKQFKEPESYNDRILNPYSSRCELGDDEYMSYGAPLMEVEDGEDILVSVLAEKEYTRANLLLDFEGTVKNILGIREEGIMLNGEDVKLEYDFGTYLTAHLAAPVGFSLGDYMIDGIDVDAWSEEILMPPGEHRWQAELEAADGQQSYPFGKEQTFTLSEDGERIVYAFNEEDYSGIRFFVEDENGNPGEDFRVTVRSGSSIASSAYTDEEGRCTVFLSEPGDYTYEVTGSLQYIPQTGSVTVGTEMAEESVSFEGYRKFTLKVTGIEMPYTEWSTSLPSVSIDGISAGYFYMEAHKEATPITYEGGMLMPQGTYHGTVQVYDRSNHTGRAAFTVELGEEDVVETVDFSHYRTVDLTVNGETSYEGTMRLFMEGQDLDGYYENENDRLLAPGKYAVLYNNNFYNFRDTVYFEIADENITVDIPFNPEDFHSVTFVVKNQPEGTGNVYFVVDENIWFSANSPHVVLHEGKHSFVLTGVDDLGGSYVNSWPLAGTFEVGSEDGEVEIDLGACRLFKMRFVLPDGSEWTDASGWGYDLYLSKEGVTGEFFTDRDYYMLPVGTYDLTLEQLTKYYGKVTVPSECPDEITVQLSLTPVSVAGARMEDAVLSATMNDGQVSVMAPQAEAVAVCIFDLNGRALWQGDVMPGRATETGLQDRGIYLIRMEQNGAVKAQKVVVR